MAKVLSVEKGQMFGWVIEFACRGRGVSIGSGMWKSETGRYETHRRSPNDGNPTGCGCRACQPVKPEYSDYDFLKWRKPNPYRRNPFDF